MQEKNTKRENYLSWDEYFMSVVSSNHMTLTMSDVSSPGILISHEIERSKYTGDIKTPLSIHLMESQVGACIVNTDNRIVGIGYNGLPTGCEDDQFPWARHGDPLDTKYPFVCHAGDHNPALSFSLYPEMNAILNRNTGDLRHSRIYVALFPWWVSTPSHHLHMIIV